jgi:tetratricopeptide (TPR) repeat protein
MLSRSSLTGRWGALAALAVGSCTFGCGGAASSQSAASAGEEPPVLTDEAEPQAAPESAGFSQGVEAIRAEKFDVARGLFEKVVQEEPQNAQAVFYLGVAQQNLGQLPEARASYDKAVALAPKLADAWVNLTAILLDSGDAAGALPLIDRGLAQNPKHPALSYNRALALSALGKNAEAVPAYRDALAADPNNAELKYGYAEALIAAGSKDQGSKLLGELAQGDNPDVLASTGRLLGRLEQFDGCIAALNKALASKPAAELYVTRGLCQHGKKDDKAAFADFQQAIKADPNYAPAHYYAGMHLRMQGKNADAKQALSKAVQLAGAEGVGKAAKKALESL